MAPKVGFEPTTYRLTAGCSTFELLRINNWLWPTLPRPFGLSTISDEELNFCVRYGNRCILFSVITILFFSDCKLYNQNCISSLFKNILSIAYFWKYFFIRLSPRPISTSQLHTLLHFHSLPIYHLFLMGSYYLRMGYLILRLASCLDAFSTYLIRT